MAGLTLLLLTALNAGCNPFERRAGWTLSADSWTLLTFVVRMTATDFTKYWLVPSRAGGFVYVADQRPSGATLSILDPFSCRVVSDVELTDEHTNVSIGADGSGWVTHEDPHKLSDPFDLDQFLSETRSCADADPAATPRPQPSLVAGVWRDEGGALWCDGFSVRAEFLLGALSGCQARPGSADVDVPEAGVKIWNPDNDKRRLIFVWTDNNCASGATVSLFPSLDGYDGHVISVSAPCEPEAQFYEAEFFLTDPIDATDVEGTIERITD